MNIQSILTPIDFSDNAGKIAKARQAATRAPGTRPGGSSARTSG